MAGMWRHWNAEFVIDHMELQLVDNWCIPHAHYVLVKHTSLNQIYFKQCFFLEHSWFQASFVGGSLPIVQVDKHINYVVNLVKLPHLLRWHPVDLIDNTIKSDVWQHNTVRVYLNSLMVYISFLKNKGESNVLGCGQHNLATLDSLLTA